MSLTHAQRQLANEANTILNELKVLSSKGITLEEAMSGMNEEDRSGVETALEIGTRLYEATRNQELGELLETIKSGGMSRTSRFV